MRNLLSLVLVAVFSVSAFAQADSVVYNSFGKVVEEAKDTAWKVGGIFGLQFTQSSYSNWQAGGVNSVAGNSLLNIFANYDKGGKWTWQNRLVLAYGLNFQDSIYNKTDDRIELESRVDRKVSKNWNASALLNFRTQFSNGYANPGERGDSVRISSFLAPAYMLVGLGATYKPNEKLSVFLSPATMKMTVVNDTRLASMGAFGVDSGNTMRYEIGGYANIRYKTPVITNVDFQANLDLYSNYLDGQYKNIDVNGEFILFMKVNKYITANLTVNVIYDNDIKIDVDDDGVVDGPRTQVKEVLGVGFAYNFGYQPKK